MSVRFRQALHILPCGSVSPSESSYSDRAFPTERSDNGLRVFRLRECGAAAMIAASQWNGTS